MTFFLYVKKHEHIIEQNLFFETTFLDTYESFEKYSKK